MWLSRWILALRWGDFGVLESTSGNFGELLQNWLTLKSSMHVKSFKMNQTYFLLLRKDDSYFWSVYTFFRPILDNLHVIR